MTYLDPTILNDVYLNTEGDIEVAKNGDFKIVQSTEALLQNIMIRCKTVIGDYTLQPQMGASLEQLIGQPNNSDTGSLLEALITNALTHDGFLDQTEISFVTLPVDANTIMSVMTVTYYGVVSSLAFSVDLKEGQISIV